jgi:hypothetical protein
MARTGADAKQWNLEMKARKMQKCQSPIEGFRVLIDRGIAGDVDTYSSMLRIQDTLFKATGMADANREGFQNAVFAIAGLAETNHALTIEATGRKSAAATNVAKDAFDVRT